MVGVSACIQSRLSFLKMSSCTRQCSELLSAYQHHAASTHSLSEFAHYCEQNVQAVVWRTVKQANIGIACVSTRFVLMSATSVTYFFELANRYVGSTIRGHTWKFMKAQMRATGVRLLFLSSRVVNRWNSLPQNNSN